MQGAMRSKCHGRTLQNGVDAPQPELYAPCCQVGAKCYGLIHCHLHTKLEEERRVMRHPRLDTLAEPCAHRSRAGRESVNGQVQSRLHSAHPIADRPLETWMRWSWTQLQRVRRRGVASLPVRVGRRGTVRWGRAWATAPAL